MEKHKTELDDFVKSILNVIIYKKGKDNAGQLRKILIRLLRMDKKGVNKCVSSNLPILLNFLKKGKNVEKTLISLHKMFKESSYLVNLFLDQYLVLVSQAKNVLLLQSGIKFINDQFNSNNLKNRGDGDQVIKKILSQSPSLIENLSKLGLISANRKSRKYFVNSNKQNLEKF